jgi:hypothetical protein
MGFAHSTERAIMNGTPKVDKFDRLLWDAELAVGILGNPAALDFQLIDLAPGPFPDGLRDAVTKRGLYFLGVVGLVQGVPHSALAEPLDTATASWLATAYNKHVEAAVNAMLERACLERMYLLPDLRA